MDHGLPHEICQGGAGLGTPQPGILLCSGLQLLVLAGLGRNGTSSSLAGTVAGAAPGAGSDPPPETSPQLQEAPQPAPFPAPITPQTYREQPLPVGAPICDVPANGARTRETSGHAPHF
ncbi:hypothetical protein KIL84_012842 [Mauremys mutica]|uniref:Uncharacterized protein n=1 Tax=Mauremys mutica TaxID=74926 RepID=A0A9D3XRS1_9SAUR|nr:hypothetical protein KIL84_012842 [Mauremys mutica]